MLPSPPVKKTIELRLYDEKRQSIQIGDHIRFTNTLDASQTTLCEVVQLHIFKNFAELYESLPLLKCGYTPEDVDFAHPDDMLTSIQKKNKHNTVLSASNSNVYNKTSLIRLRFFFIIF